MTYAAATLQHWSKSCIPSAFIYSQAATTSSGNAQMLINDSENWKRTTQMLGKQILTLVLQQLRYNSDTTGQ